MEGDFGVGPGGVGDTTGGVQPGKRWPWLDDYQAGEEEGPFLMDRLRDGPGYSVRPLDGDVTMRNILQGLERLLDRYGVFFPMGAVFSGIMKVVQKEGGT